VIKEVEYFSPLYPDRAALEKAVEVNWDATSASQIARCPRNGEYALRYGLVPNGEAYQLMAGGALHAGMAVFYSGGDPDEALLELARVWGKDRDFVLPPGHRYHHLNLGFLEVIFKNYVDFAKRRDTFKPLVVKLDDLDLKHVLGAVWRVTEDGNVVLGESKIIMEFIVNGEIFVYSGKPDLPVEIGGAVYLMDHKSTNSYLSDWYFEQYRFSNQLRGYCCMIERITHLKLNGALINGIYMGEKAVNTDFKGNRFARYGPMLFQESHLAEAIKNQYYWKKTLDWYEAQGYYPQHTSKLCSGCSYATLCALSPLVREASMQTEYTSVDRHFLDI
jgi:PD-(D/E)XK nuclease superfamily protein